MSVAVLTDLSGAAQGSVLMKTGMTAAIDAHMVMCLCRAVGLLRAEEIVCRAWDEAMNTQPDTFTWNLMGMLNNCHYRVKVSTT